MKIPDEVDLISFFESKPELLDKEKVPFYYNLSTFNFTNNNNESFIVSLCPSYNEMTISASRNGRNISNLALKTVTEISILKDSKNESRLLIKSKYGLYKISFKPYLAIFYAEEIEL